MTITAKDLALQDECIALLKEALAAAKSNGLKKRDIVKESNVSNVTICSWLNREHFPNIVHLVRVINACGKQYKGSIT